MRTLALVVTTLTLLSTIATPAEAQPDLAQRPRGGPGGGNNEALFSSQTLPKNERERRILAVLDDMDQNQRRGSMSVPANDGRLLRILAESTGAKHVVELGTSIGYSGLWFCLALEKHRGQALDVRECDPSSVALAAQPFGKSSELTQDLLTLVKGAQAAGRDPMVRGNRSARSATTLKTRFTLPQRAYSLAEVDAELKTIPVHSVVLKTPVLISIHRERNLVSRFDPSWHPTDWLDL